MSSDRPRIVDFSNKLPYPSRRQSIQRTRVPLESARHAKSTPGRLVAYASRVGVTDRHLLDTTTSSIAADDRRAQRTDDRARRSTYSHSVDCVASKISARARPQPLAMHRLIENSNISTRKVAGGSPHCRPRTTNENLHRAPRLPHCRVWD